MEDEPKLETKLEPKTRAALLRETVDTEGFRLVEQFFNRKEAQLQEAIKKHFINMKWEEAQKWAIYYNGRYTLIDEFRNWVEAELRAGEKRNPLDLIPDHLKKLWGTDTNAPSE